MNKIMDIISDIKSKASKLGACDKLGKADSLEALAKAVITASGYAVVSIHGEGEVSVNRGLHAKVSLGKKIKEV